MENNSLKNILLKAMRIGLALSLASPLVFGAFGTNMGEYPKVIFFRSIIEILFALYLFLVMLDKKYLPKISPLLVSIVIFDAILIIASIFGIHFYRSFFGDMNRGEGIIMHLHLLVFFVILTGIFKEKEDWLDLFKIAVWVSAASSLFSVLQQLKIGQAFGIPGTSIAGTIFNSDLFGSYVAISIFMSLFLFVIEQKKISKYIWLALAALNCYALFFSATRGSMVGAGVACIFIFFYLCSTLQYKKRVIVLSAVLVVCACMLIISTNLSFFEKLPGGNTISKFETFNLSGREEIWKAAVQGIVARPILGWGMESFSFTSDKYMTSLLSNNLIFDRPHDKLLEVMAYSGIIGLLSYLSMFIIIFWLIFRYRKSWSDYGEKINSLSAIVLAAFFVCYFSQNLFLFDSVSTYILFFLVAGFINNHFSAAKVVKEGLLGAPQTKSAPALKIIFGLLAFALMAEIAYEINVKPIVASDYFITPINHSEADANAVFSGYQKAIAMGTVYDSDLKMAFIENSLNLSRGNYADSFKREVVEKLAELEPFLQGNIGKRYEQVNLSYVYLIRIEEEKYILGNNQNNLDGMSDNLKKAMAFNPNVSAYYQLNGELKILQGDYKAGESDIRTSCEMDNRGDFIKCADYLLYTRISVAYLNKGDVLNEAVNLQKAFDIYYHDYTGKDGDVAGPSAIQPIDMLQLTNYLGTKYCQGLNDLKDCQKTFTEGIDILREYPQYASALSQRLSQLMAK